MVGFIDYIIILIVNILLVQLNKNYQKESICHILCSIDQCSPMYRHFNPIGWDNIYIEELQHEQDITLEDLLLLENSYLIDVVRIDPDCLNSNIAYIPEDKRKEWESNMNKKWYLNNIEYSRKRNIEWHKKDRDKNPEKYKERSKKQYQRERETILEKKKEERQGEKGDQIRERQKITDRARRARTRVKCDCGGSYDCSSKKDHFNSEIHKRFVEGTEKPPNQSKEEKVAKKKIYDKNRRDNAGKTICEVCFGYYTSFRKDRHLESQQHREAVRLRELGVKEENGKVICQTCFCSYTRNDASNERVHKKSRRHQLALSLESEEKN